MAYNRKEHKAVWDRERNQYHRAVISRWKRLKGCASCGFKEHPVALQLDHLDPYDKCKTRGMRQAINYKWNMARIKKELSKCQVLCANCHAIRTFTEGHYRFYRG